jgi:starvation-inducible DNA-binding protein
MIDKQILGLINKLHFVSAKFHIFHWNVKGIDFIPLHMFFESAYKEIIEQKDRLAEYFRLNNKKAVIDFNEVANLAKEFTVGDDVKEMLANALSEYKIILEMYNKLERDTLLDEVISDAVKAMSKRMYFIQSTLS